MSFDKQRVFFAEPLIQKKLAIQRTLSFFTEDLRWGSCRQGQFISFKFPVEELDLYD